MAEPSPYVLPAPGVFPKNGTTLVVKILTTESNLVAKFNEGVGITFNGGPTLTAGGNATWTQVTFTAGTSTTLRDLTLLLNSDGFNLNIGQVTAPAADGAVSQAPVQSTTSAAPVGTSTSTAQVMPTTVMLPSSTSKSTAGPVVRNEGLPSGAAAGLAVGCLIAGALVSGLLVWFCVGRRKTSRSRDYEASRTALVSKEKGFTTNAISLGGRSPPISPMSDILPLPLEDKAISGEISKVASSIKNHIQSYYHADRVNAAFLDLDDIQAIGSNLPVTVETLSNLLSNIATREIALRFCVAWVVCARILPGADSKNTLLPLEIADCSKQIANVQNGSTSHMSSIARWRVSTAELMQTPYVRDPFTPSDSRNSSIAAALDTLENILQPYADSRMDNSQRKHNLEQILKRSALFAFTLFSQPSTWRFDWEKDHGVASGELCIFPALVQLSDETGQRVSPPRPFSEAVVRRVDD